MRIYTSFLFIGLFASFFCHGNDEETLLCANKYGKQQQWQKALDSYTEMKQKGSLVWYNMGNCCYHLKDFTMAFIYWRRAQQNASSIIYEQSAHNQAVLIRQLNKEAPIHWLQRLYDFFAYNLLRISLLFLQILFLSCWFSLFFLRRYQGKRFFLLTLLMVMFSGLVGVGMFVKQKQTNKVGVITADNVNVFAGPSQGYHVLDTLNHIDQVTIQDIKPDWYKVKYATGVGWVTADAIQVV